MVSVWGAGSVTGWPMGRNLWTWGSGVTPKALIEAYASMTGKRLTDQNTHLPIKTYQA
nr:hypothetical protein [Candidatus Freyrarchaeum guaymaensis]